VGLVIGVIVGLAGIAATIYVTFQAIRIANDQNARTVELLSQVQSTLAGIETRTQITQESLLRERLDATQDEAARQVERAIRRSGQNLGEDQLALLAGAAREAVTDTIERAREAPSAREDMNQIETGALPADVLNELADELGQEQPPAVTGAWQRGGRGAPRWLIETEGGRLWEVTRTRHGLRVYEQN
jgi:hypothetical protein